MNEEKGLGLRQKSEYLRLHRVICKLYNQCYLNTNAYGLQFMSKLDQTITKAFQRKSYPDLIFTYQFAQSGVDYNFICFRMASNASYALHKKKYTQISVKKRKLLVQLVVQQGKTLSQAGRKLHLNPSTVRLIIKKYKQTGTFFMKKLRNTPKQLKDVEKGAQIQKKEIKTQRLAQQDISKDQLQEQDQLSSEVKVKVEENKPNSLQWYYPFLQYGFQY